MAGTLSAYPFVLALLAAGLAELSAILLRRVASTIGSWLYWLAGLLSLVAAGSLIWSYTWAMSISPTSPWGNALTQALGAILLLAGGGLLLWSLATLGVQSLLAQETSRLISHGPYRFLRRPMGVAVGLLGIGGALTSASPAMWVWFFGWLILSQPLFELEEWELQARLAGADEYLRRTPRYLPRRR
ncbi:MAG: methyltransferase family protein [Anaerolineales bacterium]